MGKKHTVRAYYDQYADQYETFYQPIQKAKFQQIKPYLRESGVLLDLGGGSGVISEWLDRFVINVDISIPMMRSGLQDRNFQAIAADLEYLPLRSSTGESILSLTAFQNVENLGYAIHDLTRILAPGAQGVISFLKKTSSIEKIETHLADADLRYERIPFTGEDFIYIIQY